MRPSDARVISRILDDFLADNPELALRLARNRAISAWGDLLGDAISGCTGGLYVRNRTLYAKITSSVVRSELILCREQLVRRLNEKAGREVIDDIVFR
ncbi:MAG: DUF721 domain-containing protein [Dysgonamonadaceae bacterium]|jgi:hypothetical protein|nr:DUF721 domain-containing protein [Dysgonamonadaceae bacterium]